MIQIHGDYTEFDEEIARIEMLPGPDGILKLDAVMGEALLQFHADVHVQTGSLDESGKLLPAKESEHEWTGEMEIGGVSGGPNNPVNYAIYEKARGGEHDFLMGVEKMGDQWTETVKGILGK